MVDDERAASPEEMLRVIERQQVATVKALQGDPLLLYAPWGVAWLISFTVFFLRYGLHGVPYAPITLTQAMSVQVASLVFAGAVVAYGTVKMSGRVRGESQAKGAMYGYTWFVGMILMSVIAIRFSPQLPPAETGLLWAGVSLMVVAIIYMAGGAIWSNWPMFFIGVWIAAVNALGVLLGPGWHALLAAVLLGAGQIVIALWLRRRS